MLFLPAAPKGKGYPIRYAIDASKALTLFVCLLMVHHFHQWDNSTALLYTAIHGSYGVLWSTKSYIFADAKWEVEVHLPSLIVTFVGVCLYWRAIYAITSTSHQVSIVVQASVVFMYVMGVFLHFCSDMQKFMSLKLNPGKLITTGLWSRMRNPNYFGELLIYSSFVALSGDWIMAVILLSFVVVVWLPNMRAKDKSLSRYPEFVAYKKRSWYFIPFVY